VLVVEDDRQTLFLYEKYLSGSGFQVLPARTLEEARATLRRLKPAAIVLDVMLEGETTWRFLEELKSSEATRHIPALVVTVTDREQKARALGADEFFVKPIDRDWLLRRLRHLAKKGPIEKVLVIDDDEVARYLVRKMLVDTSYTVIEAADGPEGVRKARDEQPQAIILDFVLPNETAFEVLDELKGDLRTRRIPVIVNTSKTLDDDERRRLAEGTAAILSKQTLSREIAIARIREALEKTVSA
jgi:CheY-like chemotaxis protein